MGHIVGIDLGTTNSCVAILEGGTATVIHNREGARTLPSVVGVTKNGEILVGIRAKRQAVTNPQRTIYAAKRLIGRKAGEEALSQWAKTVPYEICSAPNGDAWMRVGDKDFGPQDISAHVLEEIKLIAEEYLGDEVTDAVITVPAYFNDRQRQATKDAGVIAGLNVTKIVNEPTAAALGFGLHRGKDNRILAVFDLGGGTFDISILRIANGVFEVLATNGDTFLGGDDFDHRLVEYMVSEFQKSTGFDLHKDPGALARIREAAESAKCELSGALTASINLPFICATDEAGPQHVQHDALERSLFEELTRDLIERLEMPCLSAMEDAGVKAKDIAEVLLVGGMTRVPAVQAKVEQIFGKPPSKGTNPDEIVAIGAATQCAIMSGEVQEVILLDVTPHSLGVKVIGDQMSVLIPRNTSIPTPEKKVFGTTRDNQDFVTIEVYQGEGDMVTENVHLGQFTLGGLPKKAAGEVYVEVTFIIDANGIANVTAREMETGKEASVKIKASSGLTQGQLEKIKESHRQLRATHG